jgi:hypothetical protein
MWLLKWPMRRWFRVLWCILAAACLGGLPWIIIEFTRADFSIHYQVGAGPACAAARAPRARAAPGPAFQRSSSGSLRSWEEGICVSAFCAGLPASSAGTPYAPTHILASIG